MTVPSSDAVSSSSWLTSASSAPSTSATSGLGDQKMFLNLLVAQLKYQDPSNPADSSQFLAQTAQLSTVDALQAMQKQTAELYASQVAFGATSLVGKHVTYKDAAGTTQSGSVSSVRLSSAGPTLTIGDDTVALSDISTVTDSPS